MSRDPRPSLSRWAVVGGHDLLGLRFQAVRDDQPIEIPPAAVPLFDTHLDAAVHGLSRIDDPPPETILAMARLRRKYPRLRRVKNRGSYRGTRAR